MLSRKELSSFDSIFASRASIKLQNASACFQGFSIENTAYREVPNGFQYEGHADEKLKVCSVKYTQTANNRAVWSWVIAYSYQIMIKIIITYNVLLQIRNVHFSRASDKGKIGISIVLEN